MIVDIPWIHEKQRLRTYFDIPVLSHASLTLVADEAMAIGNELQSLNRIYQDRSGGTYWLQVPAGRLPNAYHRLGAFSLTDIQLKRAEFLRQLVSVHRQFRTNQMKRGSRKEGDAAYQEHKEKLLKLFKGLAIGPDGGLLIQIQRPHLHLVDQGGGHEIGLGIQPSHRVTYHHGLYTYDSLDVAAFKRGLDKLNVDYTDSDKQIRVFDDSMLIPETADSPVADNAIPHLIR